MYMYIYAHPTKTFGSICHRLGSHDLHIYLVLPKRKVVSFSVESLVHTREVFKTTLTNRYIHVVSSIRTCRYVCMYKEVANSTHHRARRCRFQHPLLLPKLFAIEKPRYTLDLIVFTTGRINLLPYLRPRWDRDKNSVNSLLTLVKTPA